MNIKKITLNTEKSLLNMVALGGFLWFFVKGFAFLFSDIIETIGIVLALEPYLLFWLNESLTIVLLCITARFLIKKIWHQAINGILQSKPVLIRLGIGIFVVQCLQFIHAYFITDFVFDNYEGSYILYKDAVYNSSYFLISSIYSLISSLLLLLCFIKWR